MGARGVPAGPSRAALAAGRGDAQAWRPAQGITLENIARMNGDFIKATFRYRPAAAVAGGG